MHRSYLFAPGHNAKLLAKVFDAGADAVMLDLEDAVPPEAKPVARTMVAEALAEREGFVVSRAAGLEPPIGSVYPQLDDETGLRAQATFSRSLGFFGKSAIHPRQLPILHDVFTPTNHQRAWAMQVIDAFESAGGEAVRLPSGEFVDVPVAQRARRLLELADALEPQRTYSERARPPQVSPACGRGSPQSASAG